MQTIGITGGTGFVGHHLTALLNNNGYRVIIFTRDLHKVSRVKNVKYSFWSPAEKKFDVSYLKELDAVIHLAGAGVADKRWTKKRKEEIRDSRVQGTRFLVERLMQHAPNCKTLIAASAIGFYGEDQPKDSRPFDENGNPAADFLAETCKSWEQESYKAVDCMRTVILRFGIALGADDGAFPQFSKPQNFGIVPILGNGRQMISWIHVDDLCQLIFWSLNNKKIAGVYNAVAPYPVSHKRLMDTIATVKGGLKLRIPVPAPLLKIGLGELSTEILKSCTVSAEKIQQGGFSFQYPDIKAAVKNILESK